MLTVPDSSHRQVVTFHPQKANSKEEKAAASKVASLQQEVKDRLEVAMDRDQIDREDLKDIASAKGEVEIDHDCGCHLIETDLTFDPDSRAIKNFSQTATMSSGKGKDTTVFSLSVVDGEHGQDLQQTQLTGNRVQKMEVMNNDDGTLTLIETTQELDQSEGKPTLADLNFGEVGRDFTNRDGYDKNFLGVPVDLPQIGDSIKGQIAFRLDEPDNHVLDYTHYSVIMNGARRLPLLTAVNIDGSQLVRRRRQNTKWELDNRIAREHQIGNALYVRNDIDRGHMVRRLDPVWGDEATAALADFDTFTYDNSNPQHKGLNRKEWVGLEDHVLEHSRDTGSKVTVFTGSVNRTDDPLFDNDGRVDPAIQIPLDYFKIAVMNDGEGGTKAVAFVLSQRDLIDDFLKGPEDIFQSETPSDVMDSAQMEEVLDPGRFGVYQVPIDLIENLTDLDFGSLRESDVMKNGESIFLSDEPVSPRRLTTLDDIQM